MKLFERYFERNTIAHHVYFPNHPKGVIVIPVLDDWDIFITMDRLKEGISGEGNVGHKRRAAREAVTLCL